MFLHSPQSCQGRHVWCSRIEVLSIQQLLESPAPSKPRSRHSFMDLTKALDGAGGLSDTAYGHQKYEEYLNWLSSDEEARQELKFDRMSHGWALGTKEFKGAVVEAERQRKTDLFIGEKDHAEVRELLWEECLAKCLRVLGKVKSEAESDLKSADWKVAIAGLLKKRYLCSNGWLSARLHMGADSAVSRNVARMFSGERSPALKCYEKLKSKIHS